MMGRDIAEKFWGLLRKAGYQVMDGDWAATDPKLQAVWLDLGHSLGWCDGDPVTDDMIGEVLRWPKERRQKLYEMLYNDGHRIR